MNDFSFAYLQEAFVAALPAVARRMRVSLGEQPAAPPPPPPPSPFFILLLDNDV